MSSRSKPGVVAGPIANNAREAVENGGPIRRVIISCAGKEAMLVALKAVFLACRFLGKEGLALSIVPEFENVQNGPSLVHLFTLIHAPGEKL